MTAKTRYLYMILCSNNAYYIGSTTDIDRRWQEHLNGSPKCKYTRSFPPKQLAAAWAFEDMELSEILSMEHRLKKKSRLQKEKLVADPSLLFDLIDP